MHSTSTDETFQHIENSSVASNSHGGGGEGYSQNWLEVSGSLPKTLTYLWPKSVILTTLFITWPKIDILFMTIATGTVALNKIYMYVGLFW